MRQCENCGKEYGLKKNASDKQRFCSTYCRVDFHQKKRSKEIKDSKLNTCEMCGKQYSPDRSSSRFCTSKCKQAAYRKRNVTQVHVKPFTIECFRIPIEECPDESGISDFFNSKLYRNGIGFDRMLGIWKENPEIDKNADIRVYTKNEYPRRQKVFCDYNRALLDDKSYPFFIMSKNNCDMISFQFDKMFLPYWESLIIEVMDDQKEVYKVGLSYIEYKDCLKQLDEWKEKEQ